MNKTYLLALGTMLTLGCGSSFDYPPVGIYTGTVGLLPGTVPSCTSVMDEQVSCCDDAQTVFLTVSSFSDGYYVDGWAASFDAGGNLYWQESDVAIDSDNAACTDTAATQERLTRQLIYSFTLTKTQICPGTSQSFQCSYAGQLHEQ